MTPLEVDELEPLRSYLVANSIWMHGADFDMTLLRREFGMLPKMIYDTQIASRLLGILRFSYANLVEQFFGVKLCKASQKENWGQRPLPEKMCEYASNDVRYLLPLAEIPEVVETGFLHLATAGSEEHEPGVLTESDIVAVLVKTALKTQHGCDRFLRLQIQHVLDASAL